MSDSYVVLGIDPSLNGTGLSIVRIDKTTGQLSLEKSLCIKLKSGGPTEPKLLAICNGIIAFAKPHETFDRVVIEGPSFGSMNRLHTLGQAVGAVGVALGTMGLIATTVPPKQTRKLVFGNGGLSKPQCRVLVRKLLNLKNDKLCTLDESDATVLAVLGAFDVVIERKFPLSGRIDGDIAKLFH